MAYYTVKGAESARRSFQDAMLAEGIPNAVEKCGFNGAMPGDGVCKGSLTVKVNAQGGQAGLMRVYAWRDVFLVLNDPTERRYLAESVRAYLA